MEQVLNAQFEADLEMTAIRARGHQPDPRASLPAALLVPADPEAMQKRICGVSVISRLICSLDRASAVVHVVVPASFPSAIVDEASIAANQRPTKPLLRRSASLRAVPTDHGLLIALKPAVIDHRVCAMAQELPDRDDQIVRFRRRGAGDTMLWFVGARRAPALIDAVVGQPDIHAAILAYLGAQAAMEIDPGLDLYEPVSASGSAQEIEDKLFNLGRKASDTWVARVFDRRISLWFTRRLVGFPITPNQITVSATVIGLLGGVFLGLGTYACQLIGSALLTLSIIVDGCDGEIARIKYMESDFGRKLDFFLDNLVNIVAIFTVGAGHYWQGGPFFYLWASSINAAAAGGSVFPVYWLFFRKSKESIRPSQPIPVKTQGGMLAFAEDISGRDFAYLILALALIGRAYWFSVVALFGLTFFFVLVASLMAVRMRRR